MTHILSPGRYELRKVGDVAESTRVTAAAAYQMRLWPKDWCPEDCSDLLETYVSDDTEHKVNNIVLIENDRVSIFS